MRKITLQSSWRWALVLFAVIAFAACAPAAAPSQSSNQNSAPAAAPTTAPYTAPVAAQPTSAPSSAPAAAAASSQVTGLQLVQNDKLGKIITDGSGRTLYLLTKDTKDTSNCYDKCAQSWPSAPAGSNKPQLGDGLNQALLGTTTRKDGSTQLTYNGHPLYYFAPDTNPHDTKGQAVNNVWWVVSAEGNPIKPAGLAVSQNAKFGSFLTDDAGRTVYIFTKDSKDTTVCYDKCEQSWPPLISLGQPTLKDGVDSSLIGSVQRKDGTMQLTLKGMPLYYYAPDQAPGDVKGQGIGSVWYVLGTDGTIIKQAAQAAPAQPPAAQPAPAQGSSASTGTSSRYGGDGY